MPSQDGLLQVGAIGQLAGSIVERRGLPGVDVDLGIGHCHSSSASRRLDGEDRLGPRQVVAGVRQRPDVHLGRVPLLDFVEAAPVGVVRVVGLAVAELLELARAPRSPRTASDSWSGAVSSCA